MALPDGFYRLSFGEERYGMAGFLLGSSRRLARDKRAQGAYAYVQNPDDQSATTWAIKNLGDNKYTIQFAEDRDDMQGFYLSSVRSQDKDKIDTGAFVMTMPPGSLGKTWIITAAEGTNNYRISYAEGRDGMLGFMLSAHRYNPTERRGDGAYTKVNHTSWGGSVWHITPAHHTLRPKEVVLQNTVLDIQNATIKSIAPEIVAEIELSNTTTAEQTFSFTSAKCVSNVHSFEMLSGYSREVADPRLGSTIPAGSAKFALPQLTGDLQSLQSGHQQVPIHMRGEVVALNLKESLTLVDATQPPFVFPIKCPPQSSLRATMRVISVRVDIPWQGEETIIWPTFEIITNDKVKGIYHGTLNSKIVVSIETL
eukprot:m.42843 g.42843  ORF g.42843 m.42843 type:complete len:368 (-) comp46565_c0_seq1:1169-2272(-)